MSKTTNASQDVWKRLSLENKPSKLAFIALTQPKSFEDSDQNRQEIQEICNQPSNSQKIRSYMREPEYSSFEQKINPSLTNNQRNVIIQCATERLPVTSSISQKPSLQQAKSTFSNKNRGKPELKQKFTQLKSTLNEIRHNASAILENLEKQRNQMVQIGKKTRQSLEGTMEMWKERIINQAQKRNQPDIQKMSVLEKTIKLKQERISFLTCSLEELKNENMDLNEKIFDMNQKVVQSELQVQQKVKEILEKRFRREEKRMEIPRLQGTVFEANHPHLKQSSSKEQPHIFESRVHLQIDQQEASKQDEQIIDEFRMEQKGYEKRCALLQMEHTKMFSHFKTRFHSKFGDQPHYQIQPCTTVVSKSSTPCNKSVAVTAQLTRIKSDEGRRNFGPNPNHSYTKLQDGKSLGVERVGFGYFEKVGSPKSNTIMTKKGFTHNDSISSLTNKDGRYKWKEERSNIASKYATINASLNKISDVCTGKDQSKLSKLGSRIEQLRNEIQKQIHGFK